MMMQMAQEVEEMKKWETIIDYTTTEDTYEFYCDTDVNGEPFKLKECIVFLKNTPCEDNTDNEVLIKINFAKNNAWGKSVGTLSKSAKNTDKYRKACMRFEQINGKIFMASSFLSFNAASVCDTMMVNNGTYGAFDLDDNFDVKNSTEYIESICIGSYIKVIGKGTHLKVIGVRA